MNNEISNINFSANTYDNFYSLTKVVGLGSKDNYSISVNKKTGLTAYTAGPFIIFYDIKKDKQVKIIKNKNNKIFTCIAFTDAGNILACGEGNCKNSEIVFYDTDDDEKWKIKIFIPKAHKYGIAKLKFFKNDKYLISIGDKEDKTIQIFNIVNNNEVVFTSKYNRQILSFDICTNFILLGGYQFLKIWLVDEPNEKKFVISKSNIELGKLKDKAFTSGVISNINSDYRALLLTSDGHLVELKYSTKQISRWMHLKTDKGISLCLYDNSLVCGCSDGIIRIFKADTLEHIITLHRPPPLGKANIDSDIKKINISVTQDEKFADVTSLCYNNLCEKLISVYSDKTFFVWDLKKAEKIYVYRYNTFHSGSINNMDAQVTQDDTLRIATCSDDKTLRIWNFKLEDFGLENQFLNLQNPRKIPHIAYSKITRRIIYFSKNFNHFKVNTDELSGKENKKEPMDEEIEITAVKFTPDFQYIIGGDNIGNIYIYNLTSFEQVNFSTAHNAQITCIDYYKNDEGISYLALGSFDNYVSIFDVSKGLEKHFEDNERSFLDDHQAPVTNIAFCADKIGQTKMITCSSDRSINFYLVKSASIIQLIQKFQENEINTYCLAYNPTTSQMIAGHNGKVTMWKIMSCECDKIYEMKRGENKLDNFRIAIDETGSVMAISNNDKYIRIRSTLNGQLFTKIPIAESISSLVFSMKNNYLIATSVEGYIYFFKLEMNLMTSVVVPSNEEKSVIKNKLKLLEKLMQNDVAFSKNEKIKFLVDKMKNSEDVKIEDIKLLNSYFNENKDIKNEKNEENTKNNIDNLDNDIQLFLEKINLPNEGNNNIIRSTGSEVIELKEEKQINEDEEENDNKKMDENLNNNNKMYLTKSKIFEKNLKEISTVELLKKSILNQSRVSLTDTYTKRKEFHIPKSAFIENIFKKKEIDLTNLNTGAPVDPSTENNSNNISNNNHKIRDHVEKSNIVKNETIEIKQALNDDNVNSFNNKPLIHHKKSNSNNENVVKNNNFINPTIVSNVLIETPSTSGKLLVNYNSKKNFRDNNKDKETNKDNVNELQQLISNTKNFVDDIDNKINNSSSNDLITSSSRKDKNEKIDKIAPANIDDEFDYFNNDERLSISKISKYNSNDIKPKGNNIFKKNLQEINQDSKEETSIPNTENKFNNMKLTGQNEQITVKHGLSEIPEDLQLEDISEINNINKDNNVTKTLNIEVSDTIMNRDKIEEIIPNPLLISHITNNLANNVPAQSHSQFMQTETFFNETGLKNMERQTTNMTNLLDNTELFINHHGRFDFVENNRNHIITVKNTNDLKIENNGIFEIKPRERSISEKLKSHLEGVKELMNNEKIDANLSSLVQSLVDLIANKTGIKFKDVKENLEKPKLIKEEKDIIEKYLDKYSEILVKMVEEKLNK